MSFDGTPLGIQRAGDPSLPVLLLANGAGARLGSYGPILSCLVDRFSFISWDYRGLFDSGRPVRGYQGLRMEDHARDALAIIDHFELDRPHVMGWSMGVQALFEAHRLRPDFAQTMVLIGGVSGRPYDSLRLWPRSLNSRSDSLLKTPAFSTVMPRLWRLGQSMDSIVARVLPPLVDSSWLVPTLVRAGLLHHDIDREAFTEAARNFKDIDLHVFCEVMIELGEHDASDVVGDIEAPVLVMTGSKDAFTPLERAQDLAGEMKNARFALIPGGTHYAPLEMPDAVCDELLAFYRSIAAGSGAPFEGHAAG